MGEHTDEILVERSARPAQRQILTSAQSDAGGQPPKMGMGITATFAF
jgi:hypothetical protein